MPNHDEEYGRHERTVRTATLSRPITPALPEREQTPETAAARPPERPRSFAPTGRRLPLLVAGLTSLLAALALLLVAALGGQASATQGHPLPRPTATATTTATATPSATQIPTPTPMAGFQVYVDRAQGLMLQYPASWVSSPLHPGMQFTDQVQNYNYEVQVGLPDPEALASQGSAAADAGAWVDYELSRLAGLYGEQFQRVPGPTPATTIGTQEWQSGVAFIGDGQQRVRVQVYATVYDGRPVVINLLAPDSAFDFATQDYFGPMLRSLTFLPAAG